MPTSPATLRPAATPQQRQALPTRPAKKGRPTSSTRAADGVTVPQTDQRITRRPPGSAQGPAPGNRVEPPAPGRTPGPMSGVEKLCGAATASNTQRVVDLLSAHPELREEPRVARFVSQQIAAGILGPVRTLRDAGLDLRRLGLPPDGCPLLLTAVAAKVNDGVELLLKAGVDPNQLGSAGCSPLYCAAQDNNLAAIRLLLQHGAQADLLFEGCPPVLIAISNKHDIAARALFRAAPEATSCHGNTPLLLALVEQNVDLARQLLAEGARADVRNIDGWDPLAIACGLGNTALVQDLLARGLRPGPRTAPTTTLGRAASSLPQHPDAGLQIIELLLSHGAAPDECSSTGVTALGMAAAFGHVRAVQTLHKAGADPEAVDAHGTFPLSNAAGEGHEGVVSYLLSVGAGVTQRLPGGELAIHTAARYGHEATTMQLAAAGQPLEGTEACPWTPLLVATSTGHWPLVQRLLEAGNCRVGTSSQDENLLHIAIMDSPEMLPKLVQTLARHAPDHLAFLLAARDEEGYTPYHTAVEEGSLEALMALLEVDPNARVNALSSQENINSPLDLAVYAGHTAMVAQLLKAAGDEPLTWAVVPNAFVELMDEEMTPAFSLYLRHDAIRSALDAFAEPVLQVLLCAGRQEAVAILFEHLSKHLNLDAPEGGDNILHWAAYGESTKTLTLIEKAAKSGGYLPLIERLASRRDADGLLPEDLADAPQCKQRLQKLRQRRIGKQQASAAKAQRQIAEQRLQALLTWDERLDSLKDAELTAKDLCEHIEAFVAAARTLRDQPWYKGGTPEIRAEADRTIAAVAVRGASVIQAQFTCKGVGMGMGHWREHRPRATHAALLRRMKAQPISGSSRFTASGMLTVLALHCAILRRADALRGEKAGFTIEFFHPELSGEGYVINDATGEAERFEGAKYLRAVLSREEEGRRHLVTIYPIPASRANQALLEQFQPIREAPSAPPRRPAKHL
jgi:ankyrin repeat protein